MKDLAKEIMLRELEIPKIHGEVDIRLKNPMTGKIVKQIKGENTFQSAVLAKGLRNLGEAGASVYNTRTGTGDGITEPWAEMVGGIFLFRNTLSNAQYMPKGNKMQANGSYGVTNNTNPPELGSWNDNESSAGSNSLLLVYDWTTSQANGAGGIASVALTSRVGGYIGYGNPSETHTATQKGFFEGISNKFINRKYTIDGASGAMHVQTDNCLYQFTYDSTEKTVTVKKSHVALTQASIFDWLNDSNNTEVIDVSSLHYDKVLEMGYRNATLADGKIYLFGVGPYGESFAAGGKMYFWEYNPANDTISEIEITNSTGITLSSVSGKSVAHGLFFLFCSEANSKTHVFKISDGTYVGYIENTAQGGSVTSGMPVGTDFPGGLIFVPMNDGSSDRIYDPDNRTCYPTNGWFTLGNQYGGLYYDPETDTLNCDSRNGAWVWNNPLYLATNYNLPSAVTKDATMTMQVRYTLTEA